MQKVAQKGRVPKKTTRKQSARRKSSFWKIYITVIIVFLIAISAGLFYLWHVMDAYEQSTPEYALQVAADYFTPEQYEQLAENAGIVASPYESNDIRRAVLEEQLGGGELQTTRMAEGGSDEAQFYQVKAGDSIIGSMELVFEDVGMFGRWSVQQPQINPSLWGELTIRLPSTAQLYINEVPAGNETISQSEIPYPQLEKLPQNIVQPTQTEYRVQNLTTSPSLRAVDAAGNELALNLQEEMPWPVAEGQVPAESDVTMYYASAVLPAPQGDVSALQAMALEDCETYSRYLSNDNSFTSLAVRLVPDSDIYAEMRAMETMFYTPHTSVSFTEAVADNLQQYNEDIFTIDTQYLYTVFRGNDQPYPFDTKLTLVYVRDGDNWLIGDIQIRS